MSGTRTIAYHAFCFGLGLGRPDEAETSERHRPEWPFQGEASGDVGPASMRYRSQNLA